MDKVLQILVVLALLMLAINYYIKAEKTKFPLYRAAGRGLAPADLIWNLQGMDPDNQLLFIAVERATGADPETNEGFIKVLDSGTGQLLLHIPVGADPGTQVFDPETRILYSANGDGTLSIFKQVNRETYKVRQTLTTRPGCRLMALDARTKKIYLPVAGSLPQTEGTGLTTGASLSSAPAGGTAGIVTGVECWVFSNL
ncbi:MAG TPA: hypothetical protein VNS58_18445 [Puia sp.]|nr:hypothetical protein [Puia sp.]